MNTKENFLSDMKSGETIKLSLMVMKIIFKDSDKVVCILADKSGEIKANILSENGDIKEGRVIDIEEIMAEIELYTDKYIISREGKALNDYFFKDEEFLDKFKRGIGGVSMHHNYIGGLA